MEKNINSSFLNVTLEENATCPGETFEFRMTKYAFYGIIFFISVIGNSFVCVVVWRKAGMKTVMNYFLVNLAAADLAFTVICIPFDLPVQENSYKWPFHESLCMIIFPLQTMCAFASVFTLAAISLSRFRAVVHPMKRQLNLPATRLVICVIWASSLVFVIPYGLVLRVNAETNQCEEDWPQPAYLFRRTYTVSIFIVQYLIPLALIFWAYVRIYLEMAASSARYQQCTRNEHAMETRKVLRTAIAVTVLFAICMLPNHIVWLMMDFIEDNRFIGCSNWLVVANICVFANSAADPIVYTVFHEKYRKEFVRFVSGICRFCKAKKTNHNLEVTVTYYGNIYSETSHHSHGNKLRVPSSTDSVFDDTRISGGDNHHYHGNKLRVPSSTDSVFDDTRISGGDNHHYHGNKLRVPSSTDSVFDDTRVSGGDNHHYHGNKLRVPSSTDSAFDDTRVSGGDNHHYHGNKLRVPSSTDSEFDDTRISGGDNHHYHGNKLRVPSSTDSAFDDTRISGGDNHHYHGNKLRVPSSTDSVFDDTRVSGGDNHHYHGNKLRVPSSTDSAFDDTRISSGDNHHYHGNKLRVLSSTKSVFADARVSNDSNHHCHRNKLRRATDTCTNSIHDDTGVSNYSNHHCHGNKLRLATDTKLCTI